VCFAPKLNLLTETYPIICRELEKGGLKRDMETFETTLYRRTSLFIIGLAVLTVLSGCSGGALTTREKGAGIGALGGAAAGGLIGAAVGHPGAGAAIGGALGLGAGALVGDQFQGQEIQQQQQDEQIRRNQAAIERQRSELERIKRQQEY
jgi:Glycine zipper